MPDFETGPIENVRINDCVSVYRDFDFSTRLLSEYNKFLILHKKSRAYLSSDKILLYRLCNIYISELVNGVISGERELEAAVSEMLDIYNRYAHLENLRRKIPNWIFDLYIVTKNSARLYGLLTKENLNFPLKNDFLICDYLKAFFSSSRQNVQDKLFAFLPSVCSYKYYEMPHFAENCDVCCRVMCEVVGELFEAVCLERGKEFFIPEKKKILASSFDGLCCNSDAFRIYEIEYIPYSENEELNTLVSCVVKYTDNILRQNFGVSSKLMGIGLQKEYRTIICDTVREKFPFLNITTGRVGRKPKNKEAFEKTEKNKREIIENNRKRTQEIVSSVDISRAKALEQDSWKIATLFGADYEGTMLECEIGEKQLIVEKERTKDVLKNPKQDKSEEYDYGDFTELFGNLNKVELGFLECLSTGDDIYAYCRRSGKLPLGICSEINEKALEYFGDAIICDSGDSLHLFPDYEVEISEIIEKTDK